MKEWWHRRRLQKWEDRLADRKSWLSRWGFSMRPSQIRKLEVSIKKAQAKVDALRGPEEDES